MARAIHEANPRGQCVPIDCGALVGTLMESELFGHAKGSFSDAVGNNKGLMELTDSGTAFFDKIGDPRLENAGQAAATHPVSSVLVGALHWRKIDLRLIAATHRGLKAEASAAAAEAPGKTFPCSWVNFIDLGRAEGLPGFCAGDDMMRAMMSYG